VCDEAHYFRVFMLNLNEFEHTMMSRTVGARLPVQFARPADISAEFHPPSRSAVLVEAPREVPSSDVADEVPAVVPGQLAQFVRSPALARRGKRSSDDLNGFVLRGFSLRLSSILFRAATPTPKKPTHKRGGAKK